MLNALRKFEFWVWKMIQSSARTMTRALLRCARVPRPGRPKEALVLFDLIEATGLGGRVRRLVTSSTAGSPGLSGVVPVMILV